MSTVAMLPAEPPSAFEGHKAPYPATEQPAEDSPLYKTDEFRMYCFKVLPCSKRYVHDWTVCPFAHPGEKAKRRDPRVFTYTGVACPDMKKCQRGDACPYAHNVFEYWMHPSRYRTQLCNDGIGCKRKVCFFAHTLDELRVSNVKLLPSDIAAGADASSFDLDPFRTTKTEPCRAASKPAASASIPSAASCGNETLVEALRAQQQQQQARKAAAAAQRTASRGLAAELQQMQVLQQLQAVLASTQGLGALPQQMPQQLSMDSLVGAMMSQLRLGGAAQQQALPNLGSAGSQGLLDVIVQQTVQQVLANNAAQQAAATLMLLQQRQAAAAAVAHQQQQQSQQAAHAKALLEHLLQRQHQQEVPASAGQGLPSPQEMHAALAMIQQQQQHLASAHHQPSMGQLPFAGPHGQGPTGPIPMPIGRASPGMDQQLPHAPMGMSPVLPPPQHPMAGPPAASPADVGSLPNSLRSSGTGMMAGSSLGMPSPGSLAPARSAPLPGDFVPAAASPSSPRSQTAPSSTGSPPAEASLSSTLSGQTAAASALSSATASSSYFSNEISRSSFESYRSSELEFSLHMGAGQHHHSNALDGDVASFDLLKPQSFMSRDNILSRSPCSPVTGHAANESMMLQGAHHNHHQFLMAAAAQAASNGNNGKGSEYGALGLPMHGSTGIQELFSNPVTMAAFARPPFAM